jgi:serine/threonine-protein kinase
MNLPVAIGSVVNDRYVIERVLGEGGMGVVVLAKHRVLDQKVAIKFLRRGPAMDRNAVQRFVKEAQAAAKLTSQYVARVHDVAVLGDGTPYIVMEYLEGATLAVLLGHGPLPVRDVTRFALQMCEVLAETHAAQIVHGDLKPENIYIAGAGEARRVKLLDFGVSKIAFEDPTSSAVVMGTPAYMAPEQLDHGLVTPASDIFAFGTVLYEMLTGQPAFGTGSVDDVRKRMDRGPQPIARPDLPPGLEAVVRFCLAVDPARRPHGAVALAAALEPFAPRERAVERINHISVPVMVREAQKAQRSAATVVVAPGRGRGAGTWIAGIAIGVAFAGILLVAGFYVRRVTRKPPPAAAAITAVESAPPPPEPSAAVPPPRASSAPSAEPVPESSASALGSAKAEASAKPKSKKPADGDRFGTRK